MLVYSPLGAQDPKSRTDFKPNVQELANPGLLNVICGENKPLEPKRDGQGRKER